jgi:hypothetical protein
LNAFARGPVREAFPIDMQTVEEKRPDGQFGAQQLDPKLAAEAAHGDLEGPRPLRGIERDRFAVEHQRLGAKARTASTISGTAPVTSFKERV